MAVQAKFHAALALLALALAGSATTARADLALARKQGCLGCHAVAGTLVGPSYQAVAERYTGQSDALTMLATRIRAGGSGQWGELPMPPQAQLTPAEARRLAQWVLATPR